MTRSRWVATGIASLAMFVLGACGDLTGDKGDAGPQGPAGPAAIGDVESLSLTVTDASVSGNPKMTFKAEDGSGNPYTGLSTSDLVFTVAQLVPGSGGDSSIWYSYLQSSETVDSGDPGTAGDSKPQPGSEGGFGSAGTLTDNGDGTYVYTYAKNITSDSNYNGSNTHRVAVHLSWDLLPLTANATYDFRPSDGATSGIDSRDIVQTSNCNECHKKLSLHGGPRIDTKLCVTCHNATQVSGERFADANSGNVIDFKVMIHRIHMGENLPSVVAGGSYIIYGHNDEAHDYSKVGFPNEYRNNCTKCHDPADSGTPDADNYYKVPNQQACGACHDDVDWVAGTNHTGGAVASDTEDNSSCAGSSCHASGSSNSASVAVKHADPEIEAGKDFKYEITSVSYTAPTVTVTFKVSDPNPGSGQDVVNGDGTNLWDLTSGATGDDTNVDAPWDTATVGGAGRLAVIVGWDTDDYTNADTASDAVPATEGPSMPIDLDVVNPFGGAAATLTEVGDGTYTVTADLSTEGQAAGTGVVAIEGHPAFEDPDNAGTYLEAPVTSAVDYFAITDTTAQQRRQVVSIANKCDNCHGKLAMHGNNRTDNFEVCVICHNPNNSDINKRPLAASSVDTASTTDGKVEESIDFKRMIHGIHGAAKRETALVVWGYGPTEHVFDESAVHFPGILNNCETCHVTDSDGVGTYELVDGNDAMRMKDVLGSTVNTASTVSTGTLTASKDSDDDTWITATASVCSACHDSLLPQLHMEQNGADFDVDTSKVTGTAKATQATTGITEACIVCHGPDRTADVKKVHDIE